MPLSLVLYKRGNNHTHSFFCSFLSERDHEFSLAKTANTRGARRRSRGHQSNQRGCRFHFFLLQKPRLPKTVAPREETHKKNLVLFSKKKNSIFLSSDQSFVLHKNHARKTQWLVRNKPLVNPPVRSNSRSRLNNNAVFVLFSSLSSSSFSLFTIIGLN